MNTIQSYEVMAIVSKYEKLLEEYQKLHDAINAIDDIGFNNDKQYVIEQLLRDDLNVFDKNSIKERHKIIDNAIETILQARLKY